MESSTSLHSQKSLYKPITNDGFVNFMRNYSQRNFGVDVVSLSVEGGKAWNRLSPNQKTKFRPKKDMREIKSEFADSCCPPRRKPCCPRRRKRPCCPPPPCCPKRRRRCCPPKPCCPRRPCCPVRRRPRCCPKPRCRPRPCCPPKRRRCPTRCQNPEPVSNNGYLNFVRAFRQKNSEQKPTELIANAARAWCKLSEEKKDEYRRQPTESTEDKGSKKRSA